MASSSIRPMLAARSAGLAHMSLHQSTQLLPFLAPGIAIRRASGRPKTTAPKGGKKADPNAGKKKKKARADFIREDVKTADQFALCDAMRYALLSFVFKSPS